MANYNLLQISKSPTKNYQDKNKMYKKWINSSSYKWHYNKTFTCFLSFPNFLILATSSAENIGATSLDNKEMLFAIMMVLQNKIKSSNKKSEFDSNKTQYSYEQMQLLVSENVKCVNFYN